MPEPRRSPSTPKPVRHRRWKRFAFVVTLAGLVGFALLSVSFFGGGDPEKEATWTVLEDIARAVERYRVEQREMPADLGVIWGPGSDIVGEDHWRNPIDYRLLDPSKGEYRLRSRGPDERADTDDDLVWPRGTRWGDGLPPNPATPKG
jgi:hypothetical protein